MRSSFLSLLGFSLVLIFLFDDLCVLRTTARQTEIKPTPLVPNETIEGPFFQHESHGQEEKKIAASPETFGDEIPKIDRFVSLDATFHKGSVSKFNVPEINGTGTIKKDLGDLEDAMGAEPVSRCPISKEPVSSGTMLTNTLHCNGGCGPSHKVEQISLWDCKNLNIDDLAGALVYDKSKRECMHVSGMQEFEWLGDTVKMERRLNMADKVYATMHLRQDWAEACPWYSLRNALFGRIEGGNCVPLPNTSTNKSSPSFDDCSIFLFNNADDGSHWASYDGSQCQLHNVPPTCLIKEEGKYALVSIASPDETMAKELECGHGYSHQTTCEFQNPDDTCGEKYQSTHSCNEFYQEKVNTESCGFEPCCNNGEVTEGECVPADGICGQGTQTNIVCKDGNHVEEEQDCIVDCEETCNNGDEKKGTCQTEDGSCSGTQDVFRCVGDKFEFDRQENCHIEGCVEPECELGDITKDPCHPNEDGKCESRIYECDENGNYIFKETIECDDSICKNPEEKPPCTPGDIAKKPCHPNKDGKCESQILECDENEKWILSETIECDKSKCEEPEIPPCTPGEIGEKGCHFNKEKKCENTIHKCDENNNWIHIKTIECEASECTPEKPPDGAKCKEGDVSSGQCTSSFEDHSMRKCYTGISQVKYCIGGDWVSMEMSCPEEDCQCDVDGEKIKSECQPFDQCGAGLYSIFTCVKGKPEGEFRHCDKECPAEGVSPAVLAATGVGLVVILGGLAGGTYYYRKKSSQAAQGRASEVRQQFLESESLKKEDEQGDTIDADADDWTASADAKGLPEEALITDTDATFWNDY